MELVTAPTTQECRSIIEASPDLLTDAAISLLGELLAEATSLGETYAYFAVVIGHRRAVLSKCAQEGVAATLDEAVMNEWPLLPPTDFELLREAEEYEAHWLEHGTSEALGELKSLWQRVLDSPTLSRASTGLQVVLLHRSGVSFARYYDATADVRGLEEAVAVWEEGLDRLPPKSPYHSLYLHSLSRAFELLYHHTGREREVHRAVAYAEEALDHTPTDSVDRSQRLDRIGVCYRFMYDQTGDSEYLEHAIGNLNNAVEVASDEQSPEYLNNLGSALCLRLQHAGSIEDLKLGVETLKKAITLACPEWPSLPSCLNNLGNALLLWYRREGDPTDLDEAIRAFRRATELTTPHSRNLPAHLSGLGHALRDRHARSGNLGDLQEALSCCERAVKLVPSSSPEQPTLLVNYGAALHDKYLSTGDESALQRAIQLVEEAVTCLHSDSPPLATCLMGLGVSLRHRYERTLASSDLKRAISAFEEACRVGLRVRPSTTLQAVRNWGAWALHREAWPEAAKAYEYGMDAADELYRVQLLRDSKESHLREAIGLFLQASLARNLDGDLRGAVTALEQGRARMLTETMEKDRTDLELLCARGREDLYRSFARASARLNRLTSVVSPTSPSLEVTHVQAMRKARAELDSVADEIRHVPEYEDFLAPPTYSQIEEAATRSPLVYLAAPPGAAGLGLIVDSHGITSLRFPALTLSALVERLVHSVDGDRLGGYSEEYYRWRDASEDEEQKRRESWFAALEAMTAWLWDVLMGSLTATLLDQGHDQAVLVPMGLLGILPLHAAWTKDGEQPNGRRYALDGFCFRYAPNARTLLATARVASRVQPSDILVVAEPEPVSADPLPAAAWEANIASSHFPPGKCHTLTGSAATRKAVLRKLPRHNVFHFSGHAYADPSEPLKGGLLMARDELLTAADLLALRLEGARLVVASACETGVPGMNVPDEVIGLPSAFVQAGAAGAVASLWIVDDLSTALLMAQFYNLWRRQGIAPSQALHQAQISVRDTGYGEEAARILSRSPDWGMEQEEALADSDLAHPYYWAAFTYTGT